MSDKTDVNSSLPPAALKPPFSPDIIPIPSESTTSSPTHTSASNGSLTSHPSQSNQPSQPTQPTASQSPLTSHESLPTLAGKGTTTYLVADDIPKFLQHDLDLSRLTRIYGQLWMAGRPMRARPLHRYKMMGQEILHTQQMDLHLLKFQDQLLVKPLPEYLLSYSFWEKWICSSSPPTSPATDSTKPQDQSDSQKQSQLELHQSATGFLLSYIWLITSPLDLILAQTNYLIPAWITFPQWKAFVRSFCLHVDINSLSQVNPRYHFGDLRLARINSIYRLRYLHTHFVRGYLYGYNRYAVFFERNFSWILVVFVFFSVVLSAMQVGVSVRPISEDESFRVATYGFVVFSIVFVAGILGLVGVLFTVVFLFNMVAAIRHDKAERRERERLAREREGEA